jgi:hypothetical protein
VCFGAIISTNILNRFGERMTMVIGSVLCVTWLLSYILACYRYAYYNANPLAINDTPWYYSTAFISTLIIISSALSGTGEAVLWVA